MPVIYTEVEVDVDLADFDTDDLIDEINRRNKTSSTSMQDQITKIYELKRTNKSYEEELDLLIYDVIGRM